MPGYKVMLVVDVGGLRAPSDVALRVLLVARILAACQKATGSLAWQYKLVNLSVAPTTFQAALHDACKASMAGARITAMLLRVTSAARLSFVSAGKTHLPFSAEEHVRCNCTMFEGLRRWLDHIIQSSFQGILRQHLQKKGS